MRSTQQSCSRFSGLCREGDPSQSRGETHISEMTASQDEESSMRLVNPDDTTKDHLEEGERGKKLQENCLRVISESPAKLYCCYGVITVLTVAVVVLSAALSVRKTEPFSIKNNTYAACPSNWSIVGNTCFYFSEYARNWTFSQEFCIAQGAQLARIDNQEELNFLRRYKGTSDHWIGLHRKSSKHPWRWTDNTKYSNLFPIHGDGTHGFLSGRISSGRGYIPRMWICSKPSSYTLQCQ
ncbi:C-type lectin domain family 2 member F-like isoform X2 [Arvicanthis niloticus]|uniref:C-type lectin domain family 2 member F-like isoform X2 n=1 Tax=Arvicanthis niloticus TaxID=61156 RepID=UPI00402BC40C